MSEEWRAVDDGDWFYAVLRHGGTPVAENLSRQDAERIVADHNYAAEREARESEVRALREALEEISGAVTALLTLLDAEGVYVDSKGHGFRLDAAQDRVLAALSAASQSPAAGEPIEEQSRCSVTFNSERIQGQCPYAAEPDNDMCAVHDSLRIVPLDSAGPADA